MIKWEALCRPKEFEGLGFTNTRVMNIALLCKWIFRLESGNADPVCNLLRRKYYGSGGFFQTTAEGGSQFWKGLHEVKKWMTMGSKYKVESGGNTFFWDDVWVGDTALKIQFPYLYNICRAPRATIKQICTNGEWNIELRRSLSEQDLEEWDNLHEILERVTLTEEDDKMSWGLTKSGWYTTKSLYKEMIFGGVRDRRAQEILSIPVPLKVKIFLWLMIKGRIQTAEQLKKMKWPGEVECKLCGELEGVDHLIFQCPPTKFFWCCVRDALGWAKVPNTRTELLDKLLCPGNARNTPLLCLVAAGTWAIWLFRNDWVFNNKLMSDVLQLPYKAVSFLKQWSVRVVYWIT